MTFKLTIVRPDQPLAAFDLQPGIYLIGRGEGCGIRLRSPDVSDRHAVLTLSPEGSAIEDLDSSNGTDLDGSLLHGCRPLTAANHSIVAGPYTLSLTLPAVVAAAAPRAPVPAPPRVPAPSISATPPPVAATPSSRPVAVADPQAAIRREVKNQIHREVLQRIDLKRLTSSRVNTEELQKRTRETLDLIIREIQEKQRLPPGLDPARLAREIYNEAMGFGPLNDFLEDDSVTEIMVNGPQQIYVERGGRVELTGDTFMDDASVLAIIERIVSPIGRRIDESQPYVDARLPDGSRVNAIIHPLSLSGPCITIRKFSKIAFTDQDLIRFGSWSQPMVDLLRICVLLRKNIIVSGGTGSGKTTLLNTLSAFIPEEDRILTVEDAAELRLAQPHVVRLESRPPNIEGRGAVLIRDLVRNALRMRPDRIIVGECRGGEALDMLQAMNTGHDGSLTTVHANTPRDVISRIETLVLMAGMDLPSRAIREQIASAVDVIVQISRMSDGTRKVTSITEVVGLEGAQIVMQELFAFSQTGVDGDGKVIGRHRPTGSVPTFFEQLKARGMKLDPAIFQPDARSGGEA
jgi:pilus assembly protein CpaF